MKNCDSMSCSAQLSGQRKADETISANQEDPHAKEDLESGYEGGYRSIKNIGGRSTQKCSHEVVSTADSICALVRMRQPQNRSLIEMLPKNLQSDR